MSNFVQTQVDGVQITGEIVYRSRQDLVVMITSPYKNIENGVHVFCLAAPLFNFLYEDGDKRKEYLLAEIFVFARFLDANYQDLKIYLDGLMAEEEYQEIPRLKEEKKQLRKLLRSKQKTSENIQVKMMNLNKKIFNLELNFKRKFEDYISNKTDFSLKSSLIEQAIQILKGELDYTLSEASPQGVQQLDDKIT